ncbi:MAG TPA: winged helix-turn-helix domain-containing protein [Lacisediminihabitans sp.]|uniref:ArsR/SmtB family transcription factor n=1 Tax=Lacisediminihabitans sp. TaxID=2787631 RepID=UPI002ED85990
MDAEELSGKLSAISSTQRMRILALLTGETLHVSELARRMGMSRALLYMHLTKLEEAGFVTGHLEMSDDGKAMKFFEVVPFTLNLTAETLVAAVAHTESEKN